MLRAIDHVQIAIPPGGEEAARPFYRDLLGLTEVPKTGAQAARGGCWFEQGDIKIHLGVEEPFRANRKAHVAFLVDDVTAIASRASAAGYETKSDNALEGHERVFIHDPFGNRLEFLKPLGHGIDESAPFPLDGGRAGDGGGDASERAKPRHRAGAVGRARHLRREMTLAEKLLWKELRKLKLNFRRQAPLGRFIVDFVRHEARLVIEVDGPVHDEPEVAARDLQRTAWLISQGYRVVRFPEKDVREDLHNVVERIIAEAAPPPSPTLPPSRGKGDSRYLVR